MNRINPLYVALLLVVLLALSIVKLNSAKEELSEEKERLKETTKLATELSALKEVYGDQKKAKTSILRILQNNVLKSAAISKDVKKSGIIISSKSIDLKALNYLVGKIFNGAYNISSLDVKKLSETKATLHMEIKW